MSINHISSDVWTQRYNYPTTAMESHHHSSKQTASDHPFHHGHHRPTTTFSVNLNNHDVDEEDQEELDEQSEDEPQLLFLNHLKEPMFEKPLTPSDVGKLNRLVIPKQHAERYFPLAGGSGGGGGGESPNDKGFLLSFEDELGKCWRFRYSYWNSSQSYVLTKGWSRYVKEKRLDAGDVVFFERHRTECDRLFIGCRRRCLPSASSTAANAAAGGLAHDTTGSSSTSAIILTQNSNSNYSSSSESRGWTRGLNSAHHPYPAHSPHHQPDCLHAPGYQGQEGQIMGAGNSKILRLFGVNMECQMDELVSSEPSTPIGSSLTSQGSVHPSHFYTHMNYSSNSTNHMDFTFCGDVSQMRNRGR